MTRARIHVDELVIRGVRGAAPSPAQIERAVRDALTRELAGTKALERRRVERLNMRVGTGSGLADAAGAAAQGVAGSARRSTP